MSKKIYSSTRLRDDIQISDIVTLHYFEFSKDYRFEGETHDFWEFVYIDKGELSVVSEETENTLTRGDLIFHRPNKWHSMVANGVTASSAMVVSFVCHSDIMEKAAGRVFKTGNTERTLLSEIITESGNAFDTPLSSLVTPKLKRRKKQPIGAEQIIKLNLCKLILLLLRDGKSPAAATTKKNLDNGLFGEIVGYLSENLDKKISLEEISHRFGISKTALKQLFREKAGHGVCAHFIHMKIDKAKTYIRENNYNITQISEMLGYNSVHYFSTQFKQTVNMSPTEYANSIRALTSEAKQFIM